MRLKLLSKQFLWIIIGIPLLTYLVLKPSFNLSLFGDDWEQLYFMYLEFDVRHAYHWFDIKSFLGPYNFSYAYLGIINNFFGLNSAAYFFVSYFFRVLATVSIYLLVKYLVKNRLAPFLCSLIFIFSVAGLETTDWVFNMNTYMGILLFNISLLFYLKMRAVVKVSILYSLLFAALLAGTFIVASTRTHGAVPFFILIDLTLSFIYEKNKLRSFFYLRLILRLILPIIILLLMMHVGAFGHIGSGGFTDRIKLGMETASALLQKGQYIFIFFLPGMIGHIVLPDFFIGMVVSNFGLRFFTLSLICVFTLIAFLTIKITSPSKRIRNIEYATFGGFTAFWVLLIKALHLMNPTLPLEHFISIFIGGETLFVLGWISLVLKKEYSLISFTTIFSLFWLIAFSLIYWLFNPAVFFETTSRYLIMGAIGFAIFLGSFLSLLINKVPRNLMVIPLAVLFFWISINFWASRQYLTVLETNRSAKMATSIWNSLTSSIKDLDIYNPTVFYFQTDNPLALHWNVVFGFPSHMGLTYKIPELNNTPLPVSDYPTLFAYVKDGSPQKMNGRPIKPVPLDHVYAYQLIGDKLIPQTDMIRKKLQEDLAATSQPTVGY